MDEFEIYCANKSAQERDALGPVRDLIRQTLPDLTEGRVHFYLAHFIGSLPVVKLHVDAKGQANMTFATGSELNDPANLLAGKSLSRTVKVKSAAYLEKHRDGIADLLSQAYTLLKSRDAGSGPPRVLRPDQPSP
ncbi:hypothetical protein [Aliihoeflea sp. PC F10.4]